MKTGLEVFLSKDHKKYQGERIGVLCNQASVDRKLNHISDLVLDKKLKLNVTCFLGPQHGIRGEKQDNMVESEDFVDEKTGKTIFSLYSETRVPTEHMMDQFDTLVVDLQDIGTRIYTFMYTMANCMRAAQVHGKRVVVLDRPNPINGVDVEGNILQPEFTSFVGQFPMPVRHGMTMGELAILFNENEIGCDLHVVKLQGWDRKTYGDEWNQLWVPPSPNIPTYDSAQVFPGMVHFEGTNVSEGRGTTKPFEWIGAPFIDPDKVAKEMNKKSLEGVYFRPMFFQPTFHKGKDSVCGGVQVHVTQRKKFNAFASGIHLLSTIANFYPDDFEWKHPPYEYEHDRMPIDLIAGTDELRIAVEAGKGIKRFEEKSAEEAATFRKIRKNYLLY